MSTAKPTGRSVTAEELRERVAKKLAALEEKKASARKLSGDETKLLEKVREQLRASPHHQVLTDEEVDDLYRQD